MLLMPERGLFSGESRRSCSQISYQLGSRKYESPSVGAEVGRCGEEFEEGKAFGMCSLPVLNVSDYFSVS
jgi:hypothetical protein